jgi:hypothetical protein
MSSRIFDLAVIGGGVIGLAHAYVAARAGKRVAVIEKDIRANGASMRNFGFITVTGQECGESWRLARRTRDVWAAVAPKAGIRIEQEGLYLTARSPEAVHFPYYYLPIYRDSCSVLASRIGEKFGEFPCIIISLLPFPFFSAGSRRRARRRRWLPCLHHWMHQPAFRSGVPSRLERRTIFRR